MRISQSDKIASKLVKLFNVTSFNTACVTLKRLSLTSYHYLSLELTFSCTRLSNFRFVLNLTDGTHSCIVERFDCLQDLLKYVHTYNIGLDLNIHSLISKL